MTRLLFAAALLAAATVAAEDRKTVIVFPPTSTAKLPEGLTVAIHEAAHAALAPTHNLIHARQLLAMTSRHRMQLSDLAEPNTARAAAQRLGAHIFVYSTLQEDKTGWTLTTWTSRVGSPKTATTTVLLPLTITSALQKAGGALADAALRYDGRGAHKADLLTPYNGADDAMRDYASCAATLLKQPIGIENPTVLRESELSYAVEQCEKAVKTDPHFGAAWAALALGSAISGNDARAVAALAKAPAQLPNAILARFWLVSRYQSTDAAEKLLVETIVKAPGFLLARAYLAELYNALGRQGEAAKAWEAYADQTSPNPFVISKLAYTLSKMGKADASVAYAEKALAYDSASVELNLELASRYLDAGRVEKAIATLEPFAKPPDVGADVVLRLGYAKMLKGENDVAEMLLTRAITLAKEPSEWRTRGRAKLNLAQLYLKKANKEQAKQYLLEAMKEGLRPKPTAPDTKDVMALLSPEELNSFETVSTAVKESSPFGLKGGEVNPAAKRDGEPSGFDAVKVK